MSAMADTVTGWARYDAAGTLLRDTITDFYFDNGGERFDATIATINTMSTTRWM